jgi:hypothetical protein
LQRKRNAFRNTNALIKTIRKIKLKGRYSDFPKAVQIMVESLDDYFNFTPWTISELGTTPIIEDKTGDEELIWSCNLINANSFTINTFIKFKEKYETFILKGEIENASVLLDEIEQTCGWSLWLIEAKFYCFQYVKGLEGNKKFLSEIYASKVTDNSFDWVYYLAYLISERNEDGCDVDFFRFRQRSIINDISDKDFQFKINTIASYFIFNELELNVAQIPTLLVFAQKYSIIDLYLLVTRLIVENNYAKVFKNPKLPIRILKDINDQKLEKVNLLLSDEGEIQTGLLVEYDSLNNIRKLDPNIITPLLKSGVSISSKSPFIARFLETTSNILSMNESFEESTLYINALTINLKHIDQIFALTQVPLALLSHRISSYYSAMSFFYSPFVEEEEITSLLRDIASNETAESVAKIREVEGEPTLLLNNDDHWENRNISDFTKHFFLKLKFIELIDCERHREALELFVHPFIDNPKLVHFFDLADVFSGKPWRFYKNIKSFLDSSIVLDAYLKIYNDEKQLFNAKACWRSFLEECKVQKPSELELSNFNDDYKRYFYFLHKVCSTFNLSQDSQKFKSPREITIERIAICEKLLENESELEELYEEIEGLERQLAIADGIQEVDNFGLTVDQARFYKEAKNKHLKSFERYKSLKSLASKESETLKQIDSKKEENALFKMPEQEKYSVMVSLLYALSDIFLKNHEFGLDYYLSMRIRHGRFLGVTRGPLERNKLITKYSEEIQEYTRNEFWINQFEECIDIDKIDSLNQILNEFSSSIDQELKSFIQDYIQIHSDELPFGIFNIEITNYMVAIIEDSINADTTMDEFLSHVLEMFVLSLDYCSKDIKLLISRQLQFQINTKLNNLQKEVTNLISNSLNVDLVNNIVAARTDMSNVFKEILTWFDISGENKKSIRTYSFDNIVEIALARAKRIHQSFSPELVVHNEKFKTRFHSNVLAIMVDAFTILLSNIQEHGRNNSPKVVVDVKSDNLSGNVSRLEVEITNPVAEDDVNFDKLENIKQEISSNKMKSRQEGGSGFHKLLALPYIQDKNDLEFGYKDGHFKVNVIFTLSLIL